MAVMDRERIVQVFFFGFLALMAWELYLLLSPFIVPIFWAILLSFVFHPALLEANRLIKRRTPAALLITLVVALGVILPALWISSLLATEAQTIYTEVSTMAQNGSLSKLQEQALHNHFVEEINEILGKRGVKLEDELPKMASGAAQWTSNELVTNVSGAARNLATFFIDFGIVLLTFFYLLRDGEWYYEALRNLTPLHEDEKHAVFEALRHTLSSVMRGLMLTALAQGVLIGLGFALTGVPYWAFLSILCAACGLLPFGGTGLVWIPAVVYLIYASGWGYAVALLIWCLIAVGVIDNFLKPYAMGQGTGLPTMVLFFGIAGGLAAYGPLGLFLGPAVISVFVALLRVFSKTYGMSRREAA